MIWNNSAALATGTVSASVHLSGATATFDHCLVANSGGSSAWSTALGTDAGNNNIDADPQFVAPADVIASYRNSADWCQGRSA